MSDTDLSDYSWDDLESLRDLVHDAWCDGRPLGDDEMKGLRAALDAAKKAKLTIYIFTGLLLKEARGRRDADLLEAYTENVRDASVVGGEFDTREMP